MQHDLTKETATTDETTPRRGRPPKSEATQERRKKRGASVQGLKLGLPESMLDHSRFNYRWINDTEARIMQLTEEDDWELAPKDGSDPDSVDLGDAVKRVVGQAKSGQPIYAYLCRKLRKFYDDDQREKSAALDEQLAQMRTGRGRDGSEQADYIPSSGIKVG